MALTGRGSLGMTDAECASAMEVLKVTRGFYYSHFILAQNIIRF